MNTVSLVVKLVAKPGAEEAVAKFLKGALALANAEPGTSVWFTTWPGKSPAGFRPSSWESW